MGTSEHLFKVSKEDSAKKRAKVIESQIEIARKANTNFTNPTTHRIMDAKKQQAFLQLWQWLDSDKDELISSMHIDITMLDTPLLEVMAPLFIELEQLGEPLDKTEFLNAVGRLYESVALPQKEVLLLKRKPKMRMQEFEFTPKINENSRQIVEQNGRERNASKRLY